MDDLLEQGITAYKEGKRDEVLKIFLSAVRQSPDFEILSRSRKSHMGVTRNDISQIE
jgi:hypothetical protein